MANTKLPARLLDDSVIPAAYISGTLAVDTNTLRVDAVNDRVGIGVTSPDSLLHLQTNVNNTARLKVESTAANSYPYISFKNDAREYGIYGAHGGLSDAFSIYDNTAGAHRLTIDSAGKVGIGITSPSTLLHLGGTAPGDSIIRQDSTSSGTNWEIGERAAGKWQIFEDDNDSIVATFMSTGKLGIGETTPLGKIHAKVTDTGASASAQGNLLVLEDAENGLSILSSSAGAGYINFGDSGDNDIGMIIYDHSSDTMRFWINAGERMRIDSSGNVNIGAKDYHAHQTTVDSLQIGYALNLYEDSYTSGTLNYAVWANNSYYSASGGNKYMRNDQASRLMQYDGNLVFQNAPTGTADGAVTFTDQLSIANSAAPGILSMGYTGATSNNSIAAFHGLSNDATMVLSNTQSSGNASSYGWAGRGGRYLTSNGTNWAGDGQDPILVIGSNSPGYSGVPTGLGVSLGIIMHNESPNNNIFSPLLGFGKKSASGSYNTMYSYIAGKSKSTGADGNWATGEIHMDTAGHITSTSGTNMYLHDNPAFRLSQSGALHLRGQPHATGHFGSSNLTNATGWSMTHDSIYGFSYINHPTHGLGLSCLEEGYYQCHAAGLVNGSGTYLYVGWCVNGVQHYHWHSNHTYTNHDFYASVLVYLSVGDFLTIENGSQTMVSQWGGNHSFYSVWKVG